MRKMMVMLFALTPTVASGAGLDLSWNSCVGTGLEAANQTFVCTGAQNKNFSVEFQYKTPIDVPDFVAITAYAVLESEAVPLSPFWHYEGGGCSGSALLGLRAALHQPQSSRVRGLLRAEGPPLAEGHFREQRR